MFKDFLDFLSQKFSFTSRGGARLSTIFFFLGLTLLMVSYLVWRTSSQEVISSSVPVPDLPQEKSSLDASPSLSPADQVLVQIEGAVVDPGIYHLSRGDRLSDLIQKAGGFTPAADQTFIAQQLNLTQKLTDGSKFYIPTVGEKVPTKPTTKKKNTSYSPSKKSASKNTKK